MDEELKIYKDKTVIVTGHTGFKGSWLTLWLTKLGAKVIGFSIEDGHEQGIFNLAGIKNKITSIKGDINNLNELKILFDIYKPEFVFHLAAQALVRKSYEEPVSTFLTNIIGTVNILECIRYSESVKSAVIVTSDKCYKNKEWIYGYREIDEMGGHDPYSASKGCAEIVIDSYLKSFFGESQKRVASVRAGNVIGGGDWAKDRIVPDIMRSLIKNNKIIVRNPTHIRPWQHVFDPLYGYLLLGSKLYLESEYNGAWNFGPSNNSIITVKELVERIINRWGEGSWEEEINSNSYSESKILTLNCNKSYFNLKWHPRLDINQSINLTVEWYKKYTLEEVYNLCISQIIFFEELNRL